MRYRAYIEFAVGDRKNGLVYKLGVWKITHLVRWNINNIQKDTLF